MVEMKRLLLLLLLVTTGLPRLSALPPASYSRRVYRVADGLPEATVQAFAQTPDRFLWIGTTGGLVRFDGTRFQTFDRENTPAFQEDSVFCLLTDRDGSLWIGMEGSGLIHLQHGVFTAFGAADGLSDTFVRALFQDRAGALWVGTNNGLFRTGSGVRPRLERMDATPAIAPLAVNSIAEDHEGRLWFGGSALVSLKDGHVDRLTLPGETARNRVKSIAETSDGTVWVGTVSGIFRRLPGQAVFRAVPGFHGTARVLRQIGTELWVSILGQGATAFRLDAASNLVHPTSISASTVLAIFQDAEQNILVGTETGMVRYTPTPLSIVPLPRAGDSDFGTVASDGRGGLWVASAHLSHLAAAELADGHAGYAGERIRDTAADDAQTLAGVRNLKVRNVLEDRDGSIWFGTDGSGLLHRANGVTRRYTGRDGLANNYIRALLQARDGSLWIGTDEGVSHLANGRFTTFGMAQGLAYQSIRALLEDSAGDLWIGTEQGLSHLHQGRFVDDSAVRMLRRDKVWALHQDAEGGLWLGTRNNGLFRLRAGVLSHFSTAEGLASHSIYDIEEDSAGHFWISGPAGISLLDRHELDRFADLAGPGHANPEKLSIAFYGLAGESETTQIFGGMQPAGAISPNGDVWFPSNRGLVHLARLSVPQPPPPPVYVSKIVADGRDLDVARALDLAAASSRLEFSFQAVMLRPQDAVRFRYKLEGLDTDWNDAGTRHVADYTNIPPGHYTFRVAAFQMSSPAQTTEASIALRKAPHFYRTWWFTAVCLLALAGAVFAVYQMRLAQMRRRFRAVLEERARLAREMHDTLLQGCASVSAVLEAVSSLDQRQAGLQHTLVESARAQMRTTINEAREAVWALRHQREGAQDLSGLLTTMGEQLTRETGVPINTEIDGEQFLVERPLAHELVMIAREAVYNAANHAAPTQVRLKLHGSAESLAMGVYDDGCGFEPGRPAPDGLHFGLVGMQERVARLGGTFHLVSGSREGTHIDITVPRGAATSIESEFSPL